MTTPKRFQAYKLLPRWPAVLIIAALSGCNPPMLLVRNSVAGPDGTTSVGGYVHRKLLFPFIQDVEEREVEFFVNNRSIGRATTDKHGTAEMPAVLDKDDCVVVAQAKVAGKRLRASAEVFHWDPQKVILVIDIDNTISYSEISKVFGGRKPTLIPIEDSKETLVRLAQRFQILYVTARPRRVLEESRMWLKENGYPDGPVLTSPGVTDNIHIAEQKQANIRKIKKDWPKVLIGIGNKASDGKAYGRCKMLSIIVHPQKEEDHSNHSIFMPSWLAISKFFEANLDTLADSERLETVIAGGQELKLPVSPFTLISPAPAASSVGR
jgi:uncharacterized protein DUF2183